MAQNRLEIMMLLPIFVLYLNVQQLHAQLFNTSSAQKYQNDQITCSESTCEVICSTIFGCINTNIDASLSETLTLSCLADDSCMGLSITSGAQTSTQINCQFIRSCSVATFHVEDSQNVNLNCIVDGLTTEDDGSCFNVNLYANASVNVDVNCTGYYNCNGITIHTADVTNALNLNCDGYSNCVNGNVYCPLTNRCNITCSNDFLSCGYMEIYIANKDADFQMTCPGSSEKSCESTEIVCGGLSSRLYHALTAWSCHIEGGCCPSVFHIGNMTCNISQSTKCVMDCVTMDCSGYIIDGADASSLTVNCSQPTGGCGVTNIICPRHGTCVINCGEYSCWSAFVDGTDAYSLDLNCDGKSSCLNCDIRCPSSTLNDNGGCSVTCNGWYSCTRNIAATNSYALDLHCEGDGACFGLDVYCPYYRVGSCNIDCSDNVQQLCFGMIITVNDDFVRDYLNMKCPNTDSNSSCGNMLFSCLADGSTTKSSSWMTFDTAQSQYTCSNTDPSSCCPWEITENPSMAPVVVTGNPTQLPSMSSVIVTMDDFVTSVASTETIIEVDSTLETDTTQKMDTTIQLIYTTPGIDTTMESHTTSMSERDTRPGIDTTLESDTTLTLPDVYYDESERISTTLSMIFGIVSLFFFVFQ